jgi:hypothetical protein
VVKRIWAREFESVHHAARVIGLPKTTLHDRIHRAKARNKAHEDKQNLTEVDKKELI